MVTAVENPSLIMMAHRESPSGSRQTPSDTAVERHVSAGTGEPATRPRRMVLVGSAAGVAAVAAVAAGIWWAAQKPSAESSRSEGGGRVKAIAPAPEPTVTPGIAKAPAAPAPVNVDGSASPSTTAPPPEMPRPAATEAAQSTRGAPSPRAERSSQRADAGKPERVQADAGHRAECGRIFQRLSLGESSPELLDRLKVLKCR